MKTFIKTYTSSDQLKQELEEINKSDMKIIVLKNGTSTGEDVLFYGKDKSSNLYMKTDFSNDDKKIPIGIQGNNSFMVYYGENNPDAKKAGTYINGYTGTFTEGSPNAHFEANLKALLGI